MLQPRGWFVMSTIVLAAGMGAMLVAEAGGGSDGPAFREATRLIDRRGRIVSYQLDILELPTATESDRTAFVSIDDDHVFVLLENEKLQELEAVTRRGEEVVRVWGTLTAYRGRNYLLVTRFRVPSKPKREDDW